MSKLDFIYNRHSVRKFKDIQIPMEDINEIIKAATYAPSGKNIQNWHFVVLRNKEIINKMADIVEKKHIEFADFTSDEEKKNHFMKFLKYHTAFKNAPTVILVYQGPYAFTEIEFLKEKGSSSEEIHDLLRANPSLQGISAAIENLILAATSMNYGTCWMTGPNYARKEIEKCIDFEKEGYSLIAMIPIGFPDGDIISPPRKPVEEVMTVIE